MPEFHATRRRAAAVVAGLMLAVALVPAAPTPAAAVDGGTFVSVINGYRADAGVAPVGVHSLVDRIAVERGNQVAADEQLGHDFEYIKRRFAELGVCWQAFGEIVAMNRAPSSTRIETFADQWFHSTTHRNIMLSSTYTHAGGSWRTGGDGRHYGVMIFVKICGATAPSPTGFWDIGESDFQTEINWLASADISNGCDDHLFCPTQPVAREQMASFLSRTFGLPSASKDYFADDARSYHQDNINRIADHAITNGCAVARFCPSSSVTRAQMASFLVRAFDLPSTGSDFFADDDGSVHEDAINRLAAAGVTGGCGNGRYCPAKPVTREQMAAFLYRATH